MELPVRSLHDSATGDLRQGVELLLATVLLLLLVGCVNVAHLFLARGAARTHELAVCGH